MPKLIVITGVTNGLGLALLPEFAAKDHTIIACGLSSEKISALSHTFGDPHSFEVVDVADDSRVQKWARHTLENYGAPDLLINNAAIMNRSASLWELDTDEFSRLIDVNIKGVANVIRHFVPAMVARKKGAIINFSSGWGRSVSPGVAPYCASKFAIEGLSKAMAEELPEGMACIPLNPGIIDTDMLRTCWKEKASAYPKAGEWARIAAPFILKLGAKESGKSISVPF